MTCCKELARLERLGGFHSDTNKLYEYNELLDDYVVFKLNFCPFCGVKLADLMEGQQVMTATYLYNLIQPSTMQRYVYPVDLTEVENELKLIAEKLKVSKAEAIREAIRHFAEELEGIEIINLRDIPMEQAKREILEFIKRRDRVTTDEIADALHLDLSLVNEILEELWSEGYVEPEN